jgi:type I site-specific restriction-modification system R (restriction) subunit
MRESEVQIGNSGLLVSRSSPTKQMCDAAARAEQLRLTEAEVAFYDALEVNDSAVKILGDETLRMIARELVEAVRKNTTIDWTVREDVRAPPGSREAHFAQVWIPA